MYMVFGEKSTPLIEFLVFLLRSKLKVHFFPGTLYLQYLNFLFLIIFLIFNKDFQIYFRGF